MSNTLHLTLVQFDISWKNPIKNLEKLTNILTPIKTDLVILPEMFNSGFCMEPEEIAEDKQGPTIQWMLNTAKSKNFAICGSISYKEENQYFNRLLFVTPEGNIYHYNKRHLFGYGGETSVYTAGQELPIFEFRNWRIAPFICYDLRFPVWSRNTQNYDLAIYIANWPTQRAFAWNSLLTARAVENLCYIAAVNRIGTDGYQLTYQGDSKVIDPLGTTLTDATFSNNLIGYSIDKNNLTNIRNKFNFLNDQDKFIIVKK